VLPNRILHVVPSVARRYGGPTESLCGFVTAAESMGLVVHVAAPECDVADARWLSARLPATTFHFHAGAGVGAFTVSPALWYWLSRSLRQYDYIHIHGLLNPISSITATICAVAGRPFAIRPFGTLSQYTFQYRRAFLKRGYFATLDRPNIRRAAALHFTTESEREQAQWHGLALGHRAFVIPPPYVGTADDASRRLPRPRITALFMGRLHPVKNLESLIAAWEHVRTACPSGHLIIAGDGDERYASSLRAAVRARNLEGSIEFRGFQTGVAKAELLQLADVFVLPSHSENFGITVLEAIAADVPVVLSPAVPLAPFVLEHGLGAVARTPTELANAIVHVFRDATVDRARAGRDIVSEHFSPRTVGQQLLGMYAMNTPIE
jgi:glycosyltransferase involved in cell wall biosynthesis